MPRKRNKKYPRKRKKNPKNLEAKKARRKKRPSRSAEFFKQKQDMAKEARRMAGELSSPFSRSSLETPINTDPIKRIKA